MTPKTLHSGDVSRETMEKLNIYAGLLIKWTKTINLIAPNTVPDIWVRHIEDSAQIYQFSGHDWKNWIDLGSGGGLPGIVIAILDEHQRPITLVESDTRKCLFLNTVRRELDLNVTVLKTRIEAAELDQADIISARALANLSLLFEMVEHRLSKTGKLLFQKGATYEEELDAARKDWQFDCSAHNSVTNPDARILEISGLRRREPR